MATASAEGLAQGPGKAQMMHPGPKGPKYPNMGYGFCIKNRNDGLGPG